MTRETTVARKRAPRKTQFDLAERERLRTALLGYMEQHRIGVPTLQVRIAGATDREPHLIPLKTLQRFLAATSRTNDAFLIPCFKFAQSLPSTEEPEGLAREFADFFAPAPLAAGVDRAGPQEAVPDKFAGDYDLIAGTGGFGNLRATFHEDSSSPTVPYGRCTFENIDGAPAFKVRKNVFNPDRDDPLEPGNVSRSFSYEGVLIFCDPLVFILLRNNLTRLSCAYWLHEKEDGILIGHAMDAEFGGTLTGFWPYSKALYFEFHRATGEKRL